MTSERVTLTDQQRAFCEALVGEGRETVKAACKIAGCSEKSAYAWLGKPLVQDYLEKLRAEKRAAVVERLVVDASRVEQELSCIAFSNIVDLVVAGEVEIIEDGRATKRMLFACQNPKLLPEHVQRAICKLRVTYPEGMKGPPRFVCELYNKVEALKILGLTTGLIVPRSPFGGSGDDPGSARPANGVKFAGLTLNGPSKGKVKAEGKSKANGHAKPD